MASAHSISDFPMNSSSTVIEATSTSDNNLMDLSSPVRNTHSHYNFNPGSSVGNSGGGGDASTVSNSSCNLSGLNNMFSPIEQQQPTDIAAIKLVRNAEVIF